VLTDRDTAERLDEHVTGLLDYLAIGLDPARTVVFAHSAVQYARDLGYVRRVLRDGNERAEAIAAATLDEVRAAMGMRY
jgi:tryptophanyl-tRNA synthetase